MEKSIESIWKEGFLKSDALVAPQINNLYNQKSIHIIDKFKRMFKINLMAIVVSSFVFLIVTYFMGIPLMGIMIFVALAALVIMNKRLLSELESIDKGVNSYEYLKGFNQWIKKQVAINKRASTFLYPIIFLSFIIGFWFKDSEGMALGERLINEIIVEFPNTILLFGVPVMIIVSVITVLALLALFGGKIYLWDVNIIYGRVFKKLEELMNDLEELKN